MHCPACQTESPEGVRFCTACGQSLEAVCPACAARSRAGSKFCEQCGKPLEERQGPAPKDTGEHRQLTVMFCDVVGSTTLSEELDPEDFRVLIDRYQRAAVEAIEPYGGHVAQYNNDEILIYFGFPVAHEDEPVRAAKAGLKVVAAAAALEPPIAVRVGIHTGPVVTGDVGEGERREQLAIGKTPNVAAHIQGLAEPNTVLVSEVTYRLAEGYFNFAPLGPHRLKNMSEKMLLYQALEESGVHGRFELTVRRGLSPFVGRRPELDALAEMMQAGFEGDGRAVLVSGGEGVGKSRLVHAFREEQRLALSNWWVYRCTSLTQGTPFYPILEMIHHQLKLDPDDSTDEKVAKMEARADAFGLPKDEIVPLVAALISLPLEGRYPPLDLTPEQFMEQSLAFFVGFILERSRELPVVFFMEDLHWVDPATLEFLGRLIDVAPSARLFIVLTARPEFDAPWSGRENVETLALEPLPTPDAETLYRTLLAPHAPSAALLSLLVGKTGGVPLYIEEMVKSLKDLDLLILRDGAYELAADAGEVAVPTSLRDSLAARLDRMGSAKVLAQLGSALGREFSLDLLAGVADETVPRLREDLDRLVAAELLYRPDAGGEDVYAFKHTLIQDIAYASIPKDRLHAMHARAASVLQERFPELAETRPDLVARHVEAAGRQPDEVQPA